MITDSHTLVTDLVMLMKDGFAVDLHQCTTIGDVFASRGLHHLTIAGCWGLLLNMMENNLCCLESSALIFSRLLSYKYPPTMCAVQLSLTCVTVHSSALPGVQGSADYYSSVECPHNKNRTLLSQCKPWGHREMLVERLESSNLLALFHNLTCHIIRKQ